jgi:putative ABC transport system permease protein
MFQQWFGGVLGENQQIFTFAVDPTRLHAVYPEYVMDDAAWTNFGSTRTGAIVGRMLANQYSWKVGDKLPLKSNIFPQKNGSKEWAFDIVGIYDGKDEQWQRQTNAVFINFEYFNEANQFGSGAAGIYVLKLANSDVAQSVTEAIDKKYENSPDETKSQTEKDWQAGFVKQIGDIGLMVRWILFAVFFTLLLVVGNTMAQSVRERIPELAVLKTLGFSDSSVLGFVMAEAIALCMIGGLIGMGFAALLGWVIQKAAGAFLPISVDGSVWIAALVAMLVLSIVVGLLPALRAQRLKIVDALAGR